jgi:vesicle-associated membrane protein 7
MIIYGLVARERVVLAEYTESGTSPGAIGRRILAKLPGGEHRKSYAFEGQYFHYHADDDGLVVMVVSDDDDRAGTRLAFACIQDIRNQFMGVCGSLWRTAGELSLNGSFARVLRDKMDYYSNDPEADKIRQARGRIEEVKGVMISNIDRVLERGDRIESLVEKTDQLQETSGQFKSSSTALRRNLWWQNMKIWLIIGAIVFIIVMIILGKTGVI